MNPEIAAYRLNAMCCPRTDPTLSEGDMAALLRACRRVDASGRWAYKDDGSPNPDWVPTYALDWAAAEAWRWKAGLASDRYKFKGDATELERHQVHQHCLKMAAMYEKLASNQPHSIRSRGGTVVNRQETGSLIPWWYELAGN